MEEASPSPNNPIEVYLASRRRVIVALVVLVSVLGLGAFGYWYLAWLQMPGLWSFADCVYFTAITITTVGFEETLELDLVPGSRTWTLALLVFGISANLYVVSSITSFFVESDFGNVRRYRRLRRRMDEILDHYIVCGVGSTGIHVVGELRAMGEKLVCIDQDEAHLHELEREGVLTLHGDATDDEILTKAGLSRARGIVATMDDDKTNMFVVVTARQSNPNLRIVTKAVSPSAVAKLKRAGADAVVSPASIGGMRLASEMLRPQVVRFLDEMLRDKEANLRIEEAQVGPSGDLVGKSLREAGLRERCGVLVIAVRSPEGKADYVPSGDLVLEPGTWLIGIGGPEDIRRLRRAVGDRRG
ncbi:potassium channel family protein [Paraliomyxa miuraensis]|uniref:potassium channel family protein n=1 Tax=Paraliomyxa miuraensis TaxID=376150 RepID=UPI0022577512|nr:potassium channel protein [Paraliomyxa miuraensis]MCX4244685.1 potassium channel protein [Paraliomyxa miuraensis]